MPALYWIVQWDWGVQTMDSDTEAAIVMAIRSHIMGKELGPQSSGTMLQNIPLRIKNVNTTFSAELESTDALDTFQVNQNTPIYVRRVPHPVSGAGSIQNAGREDLDEFILRQMYFEPSAPTTAYDDMYNRLVGTPKDLILNEIQSLIAPPQMRHRWSVKHYGKVLPSLSIIERKAPVVVLGGDPGTGKTALATSVGAPLARLLRERVYFKQMSMTVRGMGYQGRAASNIARLFENFKSEYADVQAPMILFFDEAEAIVGSRSDADGSSGSQENTAIVNAIIVGIDGLRKGKPTRIVVLFATNLASSIDPALLRRCYYHHFDRPNNEVRYLLWQSLLQDFHMTDSDIEVLVKATNPQEVNGEAIPFTQSDIAELIVGRALQEAIRTDKRVTLQMLLAYCDMTQPTGFLRRHA